MVRRSTGVSRLRRGGSLAVRLLVAVTAPNSIPVASVTVIFVPLATNLPKSLEALAKVILPLLPEPVVTRFGVRVTAKVASVACVIAPAPPLAVRLPVAVTAPNSIPVASVTVIFVPLAIKVPKSLVTLLSVILPLIPEPPEMKFAVPVIVRLGKQVWWKSLVMVIPKR